MRTVNESTCTSTSPVGVYGTGEAGKRRRGMEHGRDDGLFLGVGKDDLV